MPKKYYAVVAGKNTGIFDDWKECEVNVKAYKGAIYKGFDTLQEAITFLNNFETKQIIQKELENNIAVNNLVKTDFDNAITPVFVDGSYSKITKQIGYGFLILTGSNQKYWIEGSGKLKQNDYLKYHSHLNVAGEVFATIESIKECIRFKLTNIKIYYDYAGIEKWVKKAWATKSDIAIMYVSKINTLIEKNNIDLQFQKIKAHNDIDYNEIADKLAKQAIGLKK